MMRTLFLSTLLFVALCTSAMAHHNWAALYDVKADTEIAGKVSLIEWRNPHIRLQVLVTTDNKETVYSIESGSVSTLNRMGVTKELLKVGSSVKISGYPPRDNGNSVFMNNLLLPDGREVIFNRQGKPRWADSVIGNADQLHGKVVENDIDKRPENIFSVWTTVFGVQASHRPMSGDSDIYPLTERAKKFATELDLINDHPLNDCAPKGIPLAMTAPYPIQLINGDDSITLKMEEYDAVRTIHLTEIHDDRNQTPSILGYSTGRWINDTLVVTTTKINYNFLHVATTPLLIPQSDQIQLQETFKLSLDRNRLEYSVFVTDPVMLETPMLFTKYWQWQPGATIQPYNCN